METSITLDTLLSLPYRLFARNTIFFGVHKQFLWRRCWCDKDNFWSFEGWSLVWTRVYSYPLLIFKLCLLKLETMELTCDNFAPHANFSFAISLLKFRRCDFFSYRIWKPMGGGGGGSKRIRWMYTGIRIPIIKICWKDKRCHFFKHSWILDSIHLSN